MVKGINITERPYHYKIDSVEVAFKDGKTKSFYISNWDVDLGNVIAVAATKDEALMEEVLRLPSADKVEEKYQAMWKQLLNEYEGITTEEKLTVLDQQYYGMSDYNKLHIKPIYVYFKDGTMRHFYLSEKFTPKTLQLWQTANYSQRRTFLE